MRTISLPQTLTPKFLLAVISSALLLQPSTAGGMIDLLRGEPAPESYQRVAFVGPAVVKEVEGSAEHLVGIDRWKRLEAGAILRPGDLLRTRTGTVVLRMSESQSFVKVTPNTILRLIEVEGRWDRGVLSGREERKGFIVRACRGKAFSRNSDASWQPIHVNTVLASGTEVRTEADTIVDLFNAETCRAFRISGSSEVTLSEAALANRVPLQPKLVAAAGN